MPGPVLLTAIGFNPELVQEPATQGGVSKVYAIATKHPKVATARKALAEWTESNGIDLQVVTVRNAFDFVEWYYAWTAAAMAHPGRELIMNLTAGHAVAISTASMVATQKVIPCLCYDDVDHAMHHLNPSILLKLPDLIPRDRQALQVLAHGPANVGEVTAAMKDRLSTISRCLSRLREWGFVVSSADPLDSRRQVYELRPGVRQFLASIVD